MKKKVIAIVCAVAVLAAAGGGVTWHFLGNSTKEDDNVVYVNTVKALTNLGTGNGMENRYAGVVESENTWKVEKNSEKTVKEVYVEVGQEVQEHRCSPTIPRNSRVTSSRRSWIWNA